MNLNYEFQLLVLDVSTAHAEIPWAVYRTPATLLWRSSDTFEPDAETMLGFEAGEHVLAVAHNVRVLSENDRIQLLAEIADALADEVMGRLNRPWSELIDGTVLSAVAFQGQVVWTHAEQTVPLGRLSTVALR